MKMERTYFIWMIIILFSSLIMVLMIYTLMVNIWGILKKFQIHLWIYPFIPIQNEYFNRISVGILNLPTKIHTPIELWKTKYFSLKTILTKPKPTHQVAEQAEAVDHGVLHFWDVLSRDFLKRGGKFIKNGSRKPHKIDLWDSESPFHINRRKKCKNQLF